MINFDVSKDWVILVPPESAIAQKTGADLARIIGLLRGQAGLLPEAAVLTGAFRNASDENEPIIQLNVEPAQDFGNGFSWRLSENRLEIFGNSDSGLRNGVYGFLAALHVRWPRPGQEELPFLPASMSGAYPLESPAIYWPSETDPAKRRRLVITRETYPENQEQVLLWAVRNRIDALVLPLEDKTILWGDILSYSLLNQERFRRMAKEYALSLEVGGWELSVLVPRKHFPFHQEIFRMENGRRVKDHHFCPTNPDTIAIIQREAERRFRDNPEVTVFHLWPDRKHEFSWCSCPTCRAFTREEQIRIAANTAADVLANIAPRSLVSYYGSTSDPGSILVRRNMFGLRRLPGEAGAEEDGLFLAK
jgi:hypothetical protein